MADERPRAKPMGGAGQRPIRRPSENAAQGPRQNPIGEPSLERQVAFRTGISAEGTNATVRIGQSGITGNTFKSWDNSSGPAKVLSYGDNYIDGNADGDPAPPSIARK